MRRTLAAAVMTTAALTLAPAAQAQPPTVPNLVRVTVQGSTNVPHEWLRLHVDPQSADVFSWENVAF
jgi:hypothetical protein